MGWHRHRTRRVEDADHTDEGTSNENNSTDQPLRKTILKCVTYPTRIAMPNIFVDIVESGLPYREARRDIREDYLVMIDDQRLVGLKVRSYCD